MDHFNKAPGIVLLAVVMAGCASSYPSTSDGTDPPAPTPAASESASPEPSATEDPTPTVAPATGPIAKVKGMRVNLPKGWHADAGSALQAGGYNSEPGTMIELFRFPQLTFESVDEQARANATSPTWGSRPRRVADETVGGLLVTHLSGTSSQGYQREQFATLAGQQQLEVNFFFANHESKAERDEVVASVLASWEFTS